MKAKVSLPLMLGAWLFMASATATAHDGYHRDYASRGYYDAHYDYRVRRSHHMPRWLKRNRGFRHWYRHSPYQYNRRVGWEGLWDIYRWERRYGARYEIRSDRHDHGHRRKGKYKDRRH